MMDSSHITNSQRNDFMVRLATDVFGANGLRLEDWEHRFVASWRASSRPSIWFIGERPRWTDALWRKYGEDIKFPFPLPPVAPASLPQAEADGCQFLTREDGRQQPCNAPAAWRRQNGFRYCQDHADTVLRDLKRHGQTMHLIRL